MADGVTKWNSTTKVADLLHFVHCDCVCCKGGSTERAESELDSNSYVIRLQKWLVASVCCEWVMVAMALGH